MKKKTKISMVKFFSLFFCIFMKNLSGDEEEDDALEYDSNASIHSTDEDESGNKSPSSPKKRKKSTEASGTSKKKPEKSKSKESPKKKAPKSKEEIEDDSD